jgi:hypothetical protein
VWRLCRGKRREREEQDCTICVCPDTILAVSTILLGSTRDNVLCCAVRRSRVGIPTRARRRTTSVVKLGLCRQEMLHLGGVFLVGLGKRERSHVFCIYICTNSLFTINLTGQKTMPKWRIRSSHSMMALNTVEFQRLFTLEIWM